MNNTINYIEFQTTDIERTKGFYGKVFGWEFVDFGPTYIDIQKAGLSGGFAKVDEVQKGGALVVLYHDNLEEVKEKIIKNGGKISKDIFSFPGGKRFEFLDDSGNELAVWVRE